MLQTYWNIGKRIVEEEQNGNASSNYGDYVIKNLSRELTKEYVRGFSSTNLKMMRRLYSGRLLGFDYWSVEPKFNLSR